MLPFCFLLAFGLMSCQQEEEIIPLEADDLVEGSSEFDVEEAEHVLFDADGNLVGYMDKKMTHIYDEEGVSLSSTNGRNPHYSYLVPLVVYQHGNYGGQVINYHYGGHTSWNNNPMAGISSLIVPPGCKVTFYKTTNYTGESKIVGATDLKYALYEDLTRYNTGWNDQIRSFKFECTNDRAPFGNLCGVSYEHN